MRTFLVEAYLPLRHRDEIATLALRADALALDPSEIGYLGTLALPEDEVFFHLFEALSLSALEHAAENANMGLERVVEAVWLAP